MEWFHSWLHFWYKLYTTSRYTDRVVPDMHILYGNGHILYVGRSYFKRRSVVLESRVSTARSEDCAVVLIYG